MREMAEVVANAMLDADGHLRSCEAREVVAVVWAVDEKQASMAVEFLRHELWSYWYLFRIADVRELPFGGRCPLCEDDPVVLASMRRERWTWVLVPLGIDFGAVASCR